MKVLAPALLSLPFTGALVPLNSRPTFKTGLSAVLTGPAGKAASSLEEDIMLTLQIIRDHDERSTTVTKEQFIQQMEKASQPADEITDVSVEYDATVKLAYDASDKSMGYDDFKAKYLADAVALVKSKQPIDVSIPYDAPAKLAYESSDKSMSYADFKTKYEADAVADVIAKQS